MIKRMSVCLLLAGVAVWGLPGCSPKMTIEEMKADMPKRPVELDKLAMFEGDWEYDGQANFAGLEQALEMKGTVEYSWRNDRWYLMEHSEWEMEEFGKGTSTGVWTRKPGSGKFRNWWFDSYGGTGRGTSTYDEATRTWKFKGKDYSNWGTFTTRGKMTFVNDDTVDWTFDERAFFGLFKIADLKGTMRRK